MSEQFQMVNRSFMLCLLVVFSGCAAADKATVWTEQGLAAAEQQWHQAYVERLAYCVSVAEPATPEAEACFGDWYDADAKVQTAVGTSVGVLRTYWTARAAGESGDWAEVARRITEIVADLPPLAAEPFQRVKGIP